MLSFLVFQKKKKLFLKESVEQSKNKKQECKKRYHKIKLVTKVYQV